MSGLLSVLLGSLLLAAEPEKPRTLRYLRPAGGKFVQESEITRTPGEDGATYVSRTERPGENMTLTLRFDRKGKLLSAEAVQEAGETTRSAVLTFPGTRARLRRAGGITELLDRVGPDAVVTTAPDWSDVFQLVRRYDRARGKRQEFPGLWIHPGKPARRLTFRIENVGKDTIRVRDKTILLDRYRLRLRSGAYLAWADGGGRVYKLMPPGKPAASVVLAGYQNETGGLGK